MKKIILFLMVAGFALNVSGYDKKSIVERFTNASCGPCASINTSWYTSTAANMVASRTIAHLVYNVWWPGSTDPMYLLNTPDNTVRTNYYSVNAVPWIVVNGSTISTSQSAMINAVNSGNAQFSPFKIDITQRALSDNLIQVVVKIVRDINDVTTFATTRLKVAITEKSVNYTTPPGTNGETHFYCISRKMLPDANGTVITVPAPGDSVEYTLQYVPTTAFLQQVNLDSLRIVAFIQNETNKSIYQSETFDMVPNFVAQISSQSPDVIADNTTPVSFEAVINNIGMMSDRYAINGVLNAPNGWTGEYTTIHGTFPFGTADSIDLDPGSSTTVQVTINPQTIDGFGITSIGFESKNNPGMSGTVVFNTVTNTGNNILVVNAGDRQYESAVTGSLENVYSGTYGAVLRTALEPANVTLSDFNIVIWHGSNSQRAFYPDEVTKLQNFLDGGGNLFITGQDLGRDIFESTGQSQFAQDFYHNYLHTDYVADISNLFLIKGVPNDIISDGLRIILNAVYNRSLDKIAPRDTIAKTILTYFNGPDIAGVRTDAGVYKVVYMVPSMEQITEQPFRDTIMARSVRWLTDSVTVGVDDKNNLPVDFQLMQNYPNPFNPGTTINFALPVKTNLTLSVYNTLGEKVAEIYKGELDAGFHQLQFNASGLSSGVYFYKLESELYNSAKKMILMK